MTVLHLAATWGNAACVTELMDRVPNIATSSLDIWGREALHIATESGNADIALKLLKTEASVNRVNNFGKSPMTNFLQQRHKKIGFDILSEFLRASEHDNHRNRDGKNLFHVAAEVASCDTILELKNDETQWVKGMTSPDITGRTPLALAIIAGRTEVAQTLLEEAPRSIILIEDHLKMIPLMHASANGLEPVVKEIIGLCGESATKEDSQGRTALDFALNNGQDKVALLLLRYNQSYAPHILGGSDTKTSIFITASKKNCVQLVKEILIEWPDLVNNTDSRYGQTPLAWACESESVDVVRVLLDFEETDLNAAAKQWRNYTPLHFAVVSSNATIVDLLSGHSRVDSTLIDDQGRTPLDVAVMFGEKSIIRSLCTHRPITRRDIDSLSKLRSTTTFADLLPDLIAKDDNNIISDDELCTWVLLSIDVLHESQNSAPLAACLRKASERDASKIDIPCHRAAQIGEFETVKLLIQKGAKVSELDEDNWSWVDYGRKYSDRDIDSFPELVKEIKDLSDIVPDRRPKKPTKLILHDQSRDIIKGMLCKMPNHDHPTCTLIGTYKSTLCYTFSITFNQFDMTDIEVVKVHSSWTRMYITTRHPINPTEVTFYFEMKIVKDSPTRYVIKAVLISIFTKDTQACRIRV